MKSFKGCILRMVLIGALTVRTYNYINHEAGVRLFRGLCERHNVGVDCEVYAKEITHTCNFTLLGLGLDILDQNDDLESCVQDEGPAIIDKLRQDDEWPWPNFIQPKDIRSL
ncbi:hypothetical protein IPJ91_00250 [bacterium]|nr:MAG: hypothetical protein IPJ91_00250 [bacterium]